MGIRKKITNKPIKKKVNIYSEQYYLCRKMYFTAIRTPALEIIHAYTSAQIAGIITKEYNSHIPASTIRRWIVTPDKEFEGRTWASEWQRRLNLGKMEAMSKANCDEQTSQCSLPVGNKGLSPMQSLTEMSRKSLLNDIEMVNEIEYHLKGLSKEIEDERLKTGRINYQKLKAMIPFYVGAKERFSSNIEKLEAMEKTMDRELLFGSNVALKDPMARERVRRAVFGFMDYANKRALELEKGDKKNEHKETEELEEADVAT